MRIIELTQVTEGSIGKQSGFVKYLSLPLLINISKSVIVSIMAVTSREFLDVCDQQNVDFIPDLAPRLVHYRNPGLQLRGLLHVIGDRLRQHPYQVAGRPLVGEEWGDDLYATTLQRMVTGQHEPLEEGVVDFRLGAGSTIGACRQVDARFARVFGNILRQTGQEAPKRFRGAGCEIIYHEDRPLLVRKGIGEPSAINLEPLAINGIPYPAGSIMRVDTGQALEPQVERSKLKVLQSDQIRSIAFIHLSAFAFEPETRAQDGPPVPKPRLWGRKEAKAAAQATIEEIAAATQELLAA
jgi:hypothetical protein